VWRELKEEVGTDKALLLRRSGLWHFYDLPEDLKGKLWGGKFIGQRQKWYLLRFNGGDNDINIKSTPNPEFTAWRWVPKEQVIKLIVPFKRDLYRAVLREFFPTIKFPRL
ncbi:MAG: RNA pyrophosphohydrolase, partial [Dongiaceae bacterium]